MKVPGSRILVLQVAMGLAAVALAGRAVWLQAVKGEDLARRAQAQRTVRQELPAHRGTIYDRRGTPLAVSLERYRVGVNPERVRPGQRDSLLRIARADLGIRTARLAAALAGRERYFYAHGPFTAGQVERLRRFRGVELTPVFRREYPSGNLARPLIGGLEPDRARGASGLERFLDSLLAGVPGEAVLLRDAVGRTYESPSRLVRRPVAGHDVVLTIDRELQEIAEAALRDAFAQFRPRRGDVLFLDPRTGEILAAASREAGSGGDAATASFFVTSFEPGSTAKLFAAAALLELGRVDPTDTVSGENGVWAMPGRQRPIRDDHPLPGPITLARAVEVSSNIGMVKFADRLRPAEHYDALRAFGFGSPTGVEFGAEAPGVLPRPHRWRPGQHGASAAMGYAFQVTPVQLAAAYGAIANDGLLLAPTIIREIRRPDGTPLYRRRPIPVRQVVSPAVAAELRAFLALAASETGTGRRAQVRGGVLGKTGTAKLVRDRVYTANYAASFAGMFPARDPQLVVVVRVEDPEGGEYYGGLVAAPLTARMLRQALAARGTPIDRTRVADAVVAATAVREPVADPDGPEAQAVVAWPPASEAAAEASPAAEVPDVLGQDVRAAARALHRRGFRVRLEGRGLIAASDPAPGATLPLGRTVTLVARPGGRP
jgi:cell division protein FtsI (penicillin-binding protein 3)